MTDEEWCPSSDLSFATIGKMAFVWVVGPSLRVIRKVPTLASLWRVRPWTQDARAIGEGRWRCHGPSLHPEREERHPFLAEIVDRRNDATALSCPRITDRNGLRRTIPSFRRVSSMDVSSSSPFLDRRRTQRLSSLSSPLRFVGHPPPSTTSRKKTHTLPRQTHPPLLSSPPPSKRGCICKTWGTGTGTSHSDGRGVGGRRRRRSSRRRITVRHPKGKPRAIARREERRKNDVDRWNVDRVAKERKEERKKRRVERKEREEYVKHHVRWIPRAAPRETLHGRAARRAKGRS